jgi:membrane protein implicated in regulation of membrane protease activity
MTGFFVWLAHAVALAVGNQAAVTLLAAFTPVATTCWIAAGLFAAVALAHRPRVRQHGAPHAGSTNRQ